MSLADHVTLNFDNNMSAAVFLDIEKAFNTTCHSGLLYKLSELELLTSLIKLIASFLRKFEALIGGQFSTPRETAVMMLQDSIIARILYSLYITIALAAPGTHLALFRKRNLYLRAQRNMNIVFSARWPHCTEVVVWALQHKDQ
jgi:hypothetical protein